MTDKCCGDSADCAELGCGRATRDDFTIMLPRTIVAAANAALHRPDTRIVDGLPRRRVINGEQSDKR